MCMQFMMSGIENPQAQFNLETRELDLASIQIMRFTYAQHVTILLSPHSPTNRITSLTFTPKQKGACTHTHTLLL